VLCVCICWACAWYSRPALYMVREISGGDLGRSYFYKPPNLLYATRRSGWSTAATLLPSGLMSRGTCGWLLWPRPWPSASSSWGMSGTGWSKPRLCRSSTTISSAVTSPTPWATGSCSAFAIAQSRLCPRRPKGSCSLASLGPTASPSSSMK